MPAIPKLTPTDVPSVIWTTVVLTLRWSRLCVELSRDDILPVSLFSLCNMCDQLVWAGNVSFIVRFRGVYIGSGSESVVNVSVGSLPLRDMARATKEQDREMIRLPLIVW